MQLARLLNVVGTMLLAIFSSCYVGKVHLSGDKNVAIVLALVMILAALFALAPQLPHLGRKHGVDG